MRQLSRNELDNLDFDANLMGFRIVYIRKPLDQFHFVLYHKHPELKYMGHYKNVRDVQNAMQQNYVGV